MEKSFDYSSFDYSSYLNTFEQYGFSNEIFWKILAMWREPHRAYHDETHLQNLLNNIENLEIKSTRSKRMDKKSLLIFIAFFHDAVYSIMDPTMNEIASAEIFSTCWKQRWENSESNFTEKSHSIVIAAIMETAKRTLTSYEDYFTNDIIQTFWKLDNSILDETFDKLLEWERKIFKEYQAYPLPTYRQARSEFLKREIDAAFALQLSETSLALKMHYKKRVGNLTALLSYVLHFKPIIGVYPGSFNPYHVGHDNIRKKAESICDKVILVKGLNPEKPLSDKDLHDIFPKAIQHLQIVGWKGMMYKFLQEVEKTGATPVLIRGLRTGKDLDYEVMQLRFAEKFYPDIKVIYIQCDKEFEHISSSAIRNISSFDPELAKTYITL